MRDFPPRPAVVFVVLGMAFASSAYAASRTAHGAQELARIELGGRASGELSSRSPTHRNDGSRYQEFSIALDSAQTGAFELQSPFPATLSLFGPDDRLVRKTRHDEFDAASRTRDFRLRMGFHAPEGGRYALVVSGADDRAFGPFSLRAEAIDARAGGPIDIGDELTGWLAVAPARFQLDVPEPGIYRIAMRSNEFDSYLELAGNGITMHDDDSGGDLDARIDAPLDAGRYEIVARSFTDGATGLYTLAVTALPGLDDLQDGGELHVGVPVTGWLRRGAGNEYELGIEVTGQYRIDLSSNDFDVFLELSGTGVDLNDDDSGTGSDARIDTELAPGRYRVLARGFSEQGSGRYTLEVSRSIER